MAETSILPEEAERFGKLAGDWWDPKGASAMLHRLNPVRLKYVRDQIDRHWQADECSRTPLAGKSALDVGCGAGLLAEPLARLGAKVTGDRRGAGSHRRRPRSCRKARGCEIDYRVGDVQALEGQFDLVTSMEVIEHVADPQAFLEALAARLAPGGLLIMSTPNATGWSKLLMITVAEGIGQIPKGTHDFDKFIGPDRMKQLLADAGLKCVDVEGIAWSPTRGLHLSDDIRLNYLVTAVHA